MGTPTLIPVDGFPKRQRGKKSRYVSAARKAAQQPGQVFQLPRLYTPTAANRLVHKIKTGQPPWDIASFEARSAKSKTNRDRSNVFIRVVPEPVGDSDRLGGDLV